MNAIATARHRRRARSRSDAGREQNLCVAEHQRKLCVALFPALVVVVVVLSALLAMNAPAQTRTDGAAAVENRSSGAITGRIVGEDGQPLSNVRVLASRVGGVPLFPAGAFSDAEGKFALRYLASGAYLVNAFAPGYLLDPDPFDQSGGRVYHHVGDSVALRMIKGGVITGTVTDANGEPVVGLFVEAARVRASDGRALREGASGRMWQPRPTDDRGVYRIYGLRAGAYIIRAGGRSSFGLLTPYDLNAPTFYPSTTRDAATEVNVQAGQEMSGIDIRYRGEAGHALSGTISGAIPSNFNTNGGVVIALKHVSATAPELFLSLLPGNTGFAFDGVADGDYDLLARSSSPRDEFAAASPPRRVRVRGTDTTGITLALTPLASISGQLLFDPTTAAPPDGKASCQPARAVRADEFVVAVARRDEASSSAAVDQSPNFFNNTNEAAPDDKGEFQLRNLRGGRHQLIVRPPSADFYVRAVTLARAPTPTTPAAPNAPTKSAPTAKTASPPPPPAQLANDAARNGLNLQAGARLTGLSIYVATGASSLRGRVVVASIETASAGASINAANAGASPGNVNANVSSEARPLRVHLVPAEGEQADNALRYAESGVAPDGSFAFTNLSPGRYWLLARPAPDTPDDPPRPLAQDTDARARLRREAETANVTLSLAPCQRLTDFVLRRPTR